MSYILLVDDELEILEILEISVKMITTTPVRTCHSGRQAMSLMNEFGPPLLILSDYRMPDGDGLFLYKHVLENFSQVPIIICSANPVDEIKEIFPKAADYLTKPKYLKELNGVLNKYINSQEAKIDFIKMTAHSFLKLGVLEIDIFVKLSDNKFVKLYSKGETVDEADLSKLKLKLSDHVFISRSDSKFVIERFINYLENLPAKEEKVRASYDALTFVTNFSKALGWSEDVIHLAKKAVALTIKNLERDSSWEKILKLSTGDTNYSHHVSLLSLLSSTIAQGIGWASDTTFEKLIMASLLHDYFVDEKVYEKLLGNHDEAETLSKNPAYRQHPIKAAEFSRTLKGLPADVDHILQEHHEMPDGSGFPRGVISNHIAPLSAVFIMSEALIHYSHDKEIDENLMEGFWKRYPAFIQKDPFKKIAILMARKH